MKTRNKQRKFYYPAGLISLFFLPIICIVFLFKQNAFQELRIVPVWIWSPNMNFNFMDSSFILESHPEINYTIFELVGNDSLDKLKIDEAQLEIRKMIKKNDSQNGIHFHFQDQAKFWTFIKVIDVCRIEKAKIFTPDQNDFWIYVPKPKPKSLYKPEFILCGGSFPYITPEMKLKMEKERARRERNEKITYMLEVVETHVISIFLFFLMLILTIWKIIKTDN